MQLSDAVMSENKNFRYVSAVFAPYTGSKEYTYKTLLPNIEEDDFVVVSTPGGAYQVAQVRAVMDPLTIDLDPRIQYKWLVQKVDFAHIDECEVMESALSDKLRVAAIRKRQQEIKADVMEFLTEEERGEAIKLVRL